MSPSERFEGSAWDRAFSRSIPASGDRSGGSDPIFAPERHRVAAPEPFDLDTALRFGLHPRPRRPREHGSNAPATAEIGCEFSGEGRAGDGCIPECHHCRLTMLGRLGSIGDHASVIERGWPEYGWAPGALIPLSQSLRAAAELADDVAVLRALDRWEAERE